MNHTVWNVECEGFSKPPGYGYDYIYGREGRRDPNARPMGPKALGENPRPPHCTGRSR